MRVLIFGDSITQGFWDTNGGWVERIRNHYDSLQITDLNGRDEPVIFNLGISADNSGNIVKRIEAETTARTRRDNLPVVIVQIGINDSSSDSMPTGHSVSMPLHQYQENLRSIVDKARPISSKIIFVGLSACNEAQTTPTAWGDYYYTNDAIQRFENTMATTAEKLNIPFIPVFAQFKAALDRGEDVLSDGLHPNNKGHQLISEIVLKQLAHLL